MLIPSTQQTAEALLAEAQGKSAGEILKLAQARFGSGLVLATSFGIEDQVLVDLIQSNGLKIDTVTIDTGRLFPETYETWAETENHYGIRVKAFYPEGSAVERLVDNNGINGFRDSVALRRECCGVRKLAPLNRALASRQAWVCGLRNGQGVTRSEVSPVEWDAQFALVKINPLHDWSEEDIWNYARAHGVPYNPLHDRGYPSIGCAGCTRAITRVQSFRDGRWWWEAPSTRECGLHKRPRA